eukprot:scaffold16733_cov55-Phaeocystis_antarctica.AAC.2
MLISELLTMGACRFRMSQPPAQRRSLKWALPAASAVRTSSVDACIRGGRPFHTRRQTTPERRSSALGGCNYPGRRREESLLDLRPFGFCTLTYRRTSLYLQSTSRNT